MNELKNTCKQKAKKVKCSENNISEENSLNVKIVITQQRQDKV